MDVNKMQGLINGIKQIREGVIDGAMSPEDAAALNREGVDEYRSGNYVKAYELFYEAAENGDAWGMYNVADMYKELAEEEDGEEENMRAAFYWYNKAAHKGIYEAMFELGMMYYRGNGTEKDVMQAFAWCKRAAENDIVNAMNWVGEFYRDGEGVMQDINKAVEWFRKSADGGNKYAAFSLAYLYDKGADGISVDKAKSFQWYKKAANEGHVIAMNNLGYAYQHGEGVKSDAVKAAEWYLKAIEGDNETAKSNLESLFKNLPQARREVVVKELDKRVSKKSRQFAKDCLASIVNNESDDCFITTAVCKSFNKPDDCYELNMFRNFRDGWLMNQPNGKELVEEYYVIAPEIVNKINSLTESEAVYRHIWDNYLKNCLLYIEQGEFVKCQEIYIKMVRSLIDRY